MELSKLGPGLLTFGATASAQEFGGHCSTASIEPEHETDDDTPVLSGDTLAGDAVTNWTIKGEFVQTYGTGSLAVWAAKNNGAVLPFVFVPTTEGKVRVAGECTIRATKIGGEAKKRNTSEFEFPVKGDPDITEDYAPAVAG